MRIAYSDAGAVPVLLALLDESHQPMLYTRAAASLCNLSICMDTHETFLQAGALAVGLSNLKSSNRIMAGGAALMLANLAKTEAIAERLVKQHALAALASAMAK